MAFLGRLASRAKAARGRVAKDGAVPGAAGAPEDAHGGAPGDGEFGGGGDGGEPPLEMVGDDHFDFPEDSAREGQPPSALFNEVFRVWFENARRKRKMQVREG